MEEALAARYWCHACRRMVNPVMEAEIKCPYCDGGFIEEMGIPMADADGPYESERALSLWAPVLLGMMGNNRRRRWNRRLGYEDEDDDTEVGELRRGFDNDFHPEIESIIRRRRRSSATILQLLRDSRAGVVSDLGNADSDRDDDGDRIHRRDRGRERNVILINPFNQTIVLQGSSDLSNQNSNLIGSLGDYFNGPGLDLLLQHLAENDPNGHGTAPAKKEAIEAMPTVKMKENVQCSVCLDDFQIGTEAREMPCKHKFHSGCILPWLELHSSCPVCRFQLPTDDSKGDSEGPTVGNNGGEREAVSGVTGQSNDEEADEGNRRNEGGGRFSFPWSFSSLFSSASGSNTRGGNSTSLRSNEHEGTSSQRDGN